MSNLLELTGKYAELMSLALDPETDEQVLYDTMEAVEGEVGVKMGGYLAVINNLDARADMYDKEADRLKDASKVIKNNIARMKERIKYAMTLMKTKEIQTPYHVIKIVKNGGVEPLKITGEVPQNLKKVVLENDNEKIRKALKDGEKLTFAHLEERGTHLSIK